MKALSDGKILVTGGAGMIGSALIHALNQRGIERIIVADHLRTDEKWKNLVPLRFEDYMESEKFLKTITDHPKYFGDFSTIFHLGACSSTTETDARYLVQNNYEYTKELALHALAEGWRFVYASSAATYGDGTRGMNDSLEGIENLLPVNMYGYSKHLFDLYAKRQGLFDKITGIKYFNIFGPNEYHKGSMRSVVLKGFQQIIATDCIRLFKSYHPDFQNGMQKRDFLYVKDAVEMTLYLAEHAEAVGLFNLGSGQAHTWICLATAIFSALGKEVKIDFIDMPENLKKKYQYYTKANISKLKALGYSKPITLIEDAVHDYVQHYLVPHKHLGET